MHKDRKLYDEFNKLYFMKFDLRLIEYEEKESKTIIAIAVAASRKDKECERRKESLLIILSKHINKSHRYKLRGNRVKDKLQLKLRDERKTVMMKLKGFS